MSRRPQSFIVRTQGGLVVLPTRRARREWRIARKLRQQPLRRRMKVWLHRQRRVLLVYGMSALVHTVLLLLLAVIAIRFERNRGDEDVQLTQLVAAQRPEELLAILDLPVVEPVQAVPRINSSAVQAVHEVVEDRAVDEPALPALQVKSPISSADAAATADELTVEIAVLDNDATGPGGGAPDEGINRLKSQFAGRTDAARPVLVKAFGGNDASEAAVAAGLKWLAAHQRYDGSWSFDHTTAACDGTCNSPGKLVDCEIGGTAMALLTFLGAGRTHQHGEYQKEVAAGIDFLLDNLTWDADEKRLDLRDGSLRMAAFYVQGMASMTLSEAYAMTGDRRLLKPAQGAVDFIVWAQDPKGGGWRYFPQSPGDTSVVGWQAMALTSARVAELEVPEGTILKAVRFLESVRTPRGVGYGYTNRFPRPSTTAIAVLCRMYLEPDVPRQGFARAAETLAELGPAAEDMYYNYYATQFMHHYGGAEWESWNEKMRDWLIETQETTGHAAGSWFPRDRHARHGGRLYVTTMAIMTLEVYYRHLPLYQHGVELVELPE